MNLPESGSPSGASSQDTIHKGGPQIIQHRLRNHYADCYTASHNTQNCPTYDMPLPSTILQTISVSSDISVACRGGNASCSSCIHSRNAMPRVNRSCPTSLNSSLSSAHQSFSRSDRYIYEHCTDSASPRSDRISSASGPRNI